MKNMQRDVLKILAGITLIISPFFATYAQVASFRLNMADSLYEKKQYTQSLEHYQAILDRNEYTPSMLLKMAYIEEGLNRVGQALYYLDRYYLVTNDNFALDKMEELATKYNLDGYKNTDTTLLLSWYHDFRLPISFALSALAVFFLSMIFYWRKRGKRSAAAGVFLFLVITVLGVHINAGEKISTGIIGEPNTFLMAGPSPGASVISIVEEGHRVEIVGKVDVWYKVRWNENTVYVRDHDLLTKEL